MHVPEQSDARHNRVAAAAPRIGMGIIDRYIIRQVLVPFGIGLLVFTFIFIIEALRRYVEPLVAKGVPIPVLATVLATLVPQALALSIPMSLLLGLLVAFGRLSGDREFVAMQACGISLRRLLTPVGLLSVVGWAATSYVMLVAVPSSNQLFREVAFSVMADRAEGEVKPRVFFDDFPDLVIYVREVPASGQGWLGVFMADSRPGQQPAIYLARRGRVVIDRGARTVHVILDDVTQHTHEGGEYRAAYVRQVVQVLDPATVFPSAGPLKGFAEMSIAELQTQIARNQIDGVSTHNERMAIQRKFAIPVACLVFGVIGLALGATNARGGAFGSFGFGLVVVFAYYLPTYFFPQLTKGGYLTPWLATWLPNILLGAVAVVLFLWRNRIADQPIRPPVPAAVRRLFTRRPGVMRGASFPGAFITRLLDRYVGGMFVRTLILSATAAMAVVYIATFIDLSDKLFKGVVSWRTLLEYFGFATAQFAYYTLPISVLVATLVTIGALTRNSELVVMKACGVSLYRTAVPMLVCAMAVGAILFLMDATFLGPANRRAEELRDVMRGSARLQPLNEPWLVGRDGTIYHVPGGYDARLRRFAQVNVYQFDAGMTRLRSRTFAAHGTYAGGADDEADAVWQLENGWTRTFDEKGELQTFEPFTRAPRRLEPVSYFAQEPPDERFMSYDELRRHTDRLRTSGVDVADFEVGIARKVAYPFVCLIMTLVAIPFATTIGRSGTMAGIAVGVAVALVYWGAITISAALGAGGLLEPVLAAWAPNLLFGAGAAYLLLTVRT
jgi:LPS export ABC transporter permease LptG/LPS export ABC transporter permease LptF